MATGGKISELLVRGRFTLSFEYSAPKTEEGWISLLAAVERLAAVSPDFVSVTYGAGGSTRTQTFELCQEIQAKAPGLVMAHLTGICHTRVEMGVIADKLWEAGIRNIMALRGDVPRTNLHQAPVEDGFEYGKDLIAFLKARHDFCVGGGSYPEGHPETPDLQAGIEHLRQKVEAGCDFLVTQVFFDNARYFAHRDQLLEAGVDVPVIPGIMPITQLSQLSRFQNQFGAKMPSGLVNEILAHADDKAAIEEIGVEFAAKQCRELIEAGAPGIHFYTLNRSRATVRVCEKLKIHQGDRVASF